MGCAATQQAGNYVRTDGRQVDDAQRRAVLAQCQAEASAAVRETRTVSPVYGGLTSIGDEKTALNGCMARNGYITQ
jgi:hypothetical protein